MDQILLGTGGIEQGFCTPGGQNAYFKTYICECMEAYTEEHKFTVRYWIAAGAQRRDTQPAG